MKGASGERVLVLGTGAMGSLFGARLADRGGCDVTVAGSWRPALERIAREGIRVEEPEGSRTVRVDARGLEEVSPPYDLVLVLTKSWQTAAIADTAAKAIQDEGLVLTLQNGLGNREILARAAGDERVAAGVTSVGATLLGPGRVRSGGLGRTVIGVSGPGRQRLQPTVAALGRAGFSVEVTDDLPRAQWTKLAVSCAINPLSALAGLDNGRLAAVPAWRRELEAAAREVGRVASARGIELDRDPARQALAVARTTARNRSSMLQDVERGRPTEIEALNGAVVAEGRRLGVPTPINALLAERIRGLSGQPETPAGGSP